LTKSCVAEHFSLVHKTCRQVHCRVRFNAMQHWTALRNQSPEEPPPGRGAQRGLAPGKLAQPFEGEVAKAIVDMGIHARDLVALLRE
jgi:hypothetical protein